MWQFRVTSEFRHYSASQSDTLSLKVNVFWNPRWNNFLTSYALPPQDIFQWLSGTSALRCRAKHSASGELNICEIAKENAGHFTPRCHDHVSL